MNRFYSTAFKYLSFTVVLITITFLVTNKSNTYQKSISDKEYFVQFIFYSSAIIYSTLIAIITYIGRKIDLGFLTPSLIFIFGIIPSILFLFITIFILIDLFQVLF
jgi:hypothetical protein